jgi:hypothetical protein
VKRFKVHCDTNFCGVNEEVVVEAADEVEAEAIATIAIDWWNETVYPFVVVNGETEEEATI